MVGEEAREGCEDRAGCESCDSVQVVNNLHVTVNIELCGGGQKSGMFDSDECEKVVAMMTTALKASKLGSQNIQVGASKRASSLVVGCPHCSKKGHIL